MQSAGQCTTGLKTQPGFPVLPLRICTDTDGYKSVLGAQLGLISTDKSVLFHTAARMPPKFFFAPYGRERRLRTMHSAPPPPAPGLQYGESLYCWPAPPCCPILGFLTPIVRCNKYWRSGGAAALSHSPSHQRQYGTDQVTNDPKATIHKPQIWQTGTLLVIYEEKRSINIWVPRCMPTGATADKPIGSMATDYNVDQCAITMK